MPRPRPVAVFVGLTVAGFAPCSIWRSLDEVPADLGRTVVTIGNFDGVHLGHQHVRPPGPRGRRRARPDRVVVVTFDPHPIAVLRPEHAPPTLTTRRRPARAARRRPGPTTCWCCRSTATMAGWSPEEFIDRVLVDALHAAAVVVGANFRFGHRAAGDVALLHRARARPADFDVVGVALDGGPQVWSSTYVRNCLAAGDVEGAAEALGPAVHRARRRSCEGDQRGRELGFPTANVPTDGGRGGARRRRVRRVAAASRHRRAPSRPRSRVGTNPTFAGERERRVESYVLDRTDLELYGVEVEVAFVDRLRGMIAFDAVDALVEQMARRRRPRPRAPGSPDVEPRQRPRRRPPPSSWFVSAGPALLRRRASAAGVRAGLRRPRLVALALTATGAGGAGGGPGRGLAGSADVGQRRPVAAIWRRAGWRRRWLRPQPPCARG